MEEDIDKIFNHFGISNQKRKLVEEIYEFLEAVTLYETGSGNIADVIEEFSDVELVMRQFKQYYNITDTEQLHETAYKVARTIDKYKIK